MAALTELSRVGRTLRNPQHHWHVRAKPFVIQPVAIAPVLPGETLKNALFQSRVVTAPIKNPLIGWWQEYYWFYVKHRDLAGSEDFQQMMLDPSHSMSAQLDATADVDYFHIANKINWQKQCLTAVVTEYFRNEGEDWDDYLVDAMPIAGVQHNGLYDSLTSSTAYEDQDFSVDLDADTTITASEIDRAMMHWDFLRANNLTEMSYEDYLRSFGVKVRPEERNVPELLRYVREWSYPVNTVDPSTGTPSSAVSWAISERMDKDRYFKEPGFIFGVTVSRPKVYFSGQSGAGVALLDDAYSWLPAIMKNDPRTSLKQIATAATSILPDGADGMWVDVKDLFLYGDQFINFALTETNAGLVALPDSNLNRRYVTDASIQALFAGADYTVKQDGVVRLSILGSQMDTTPRGSSTGVVI